MLVFLMLQACASADVSTVDLIPRDMVKSIKVSTVDVTMLIPKPNPRLQTTLKQELETALPACAAGDVPYRMNVIVTDFDEMDVGKAVMIGDEIELQGKVQLFNDATGAKAGEYFVERSFFWGGLIGAAMMADAEQSLSKSFAETVCDEIFGVDIASEQK